MLKTKYIVLIIVLFLASCSSSVEADRLYFKEIRNHDISIQWFYYSLVGNTTPEYVIVNDIQNNSCDTICQADRIKDIYLKKDTIFLVFYSDPSKYGKVITIPDKVYNYRINTLVEYQEGVVPVKSTYMKTKK